MLSPTALGLTSAQETTYLRTLAESHPIRIVVRVHDHNEAVIKEIHPQVQAGSVQVDMDSEVKRSLTLTLLDPNHQLHFDSTNPAEGALYADNFISVEYGVWVADLDRWVDAPVFMGPITRFRREGEVVDIEAQGKESLGLDPHLTIRPFTIRKGTTVAAAIRRVMGEVGETRFSLGMISGRLPKARAVVPGEAPWLIVTGGEEPGNFAERKKRWRARHLSPVIGLMSKAVGNWLLFYDGRGRLTAKRRNMKSVFTFRHDMHVITKPSYEYDVLEFRNHAEVLGGVPKKSKRRCRGEYTLPASHALSPSALARNGRGRFLTIFFESDALKSDAACRAKARRLVEAVAHEGIAARFDSLVIPTVEEGDVVSLDMGEYHMTFNLRSFTIPLTASETMAVGYNKRAKLPRRRRSF